MIPPVKYISEPSWKMSIIRKINWKESKEVKIHNKISSYGAERFKANISMDHKSVNQLSKKIIELFKNLL